MRRLQRVGRRGPIASFLVIAVAVGFVVLSSCDLSDPPAGRPGDFSVELVFPSDAGGQSGKAALDDSVLVRALLFNLGTDEQDAFVQRPTLESPDFDDEDSVQGGGVLTLETEIITSQTWYRVLIDAGTYQGQSSFSLRPEDLRQRVAVVLAPSSFESDSLGFFDRLAAGSLSAPADTPTDSSRSLFPLLVQNSEPIDGLQLVFMAVDAQAAEVVTDPGSRLFDQGDEESVSIDLVLLDDAVAERPIYRLRVQVVGSGVIAAGSDILLYLATLEGSSSSGLCVLPGSVRYLLVGGGTSEEVGLDADAGACPWAPRAHADEAICALDDVVIDVLANDIDFDGRLLPGSVTVTTSPGNGEVTVLEGGVILYAPDVGFEGIDVFSYTVRDDNGLESNPALVTVTVLERPDAECTVTPLAIDFGRITVGEAAVDTFVIANTGVAGRVNGLVGPGDCPGVFDVVEGGGVFSLGVGEERLVVVRYTPTAEVESFCALDLGANDCAEVGLAGRGYDPNCTILVTGPSTEDVVYLGEDREITWDPSLACGDWVGIELWSKGNYVTNLSGEGTENDGSFVWPVRSWYLGEPDDRYTVVVWNWNTEEAFEGGEFIIRSPLNLVPPVLDFGGVAVGDVVGRTCLFENLMNQPLDLFISDLAPIFSVEGEGLITIPPLGSVPVQVDFAPEAAGPVNGSLRAYGPGETLLGTVGCSGVGYFESACFQFYNDTNDWVMDVSICDADICQPASGTSLTFDWVDHTNAGSLPGGDVFPADGSVELTVPPGLVVDDPPAGFVTWRAEIWSPSLVGTDEWQAAFAARLQIYFDGDTAQFDNLQTILWLRIRDLLTDEVQWFPQTIAVQPQYWNDVYWPWWDYQFPEVYDVERVVVMIAGTIGASTPGRVYIDEVCPVWEAGPSAPETQAAGGDVGRPPACLNLR